MIYKILSGKQDFFIDKKALFCYSLPMTIDEVQKLADLIRIDMDQAELESVMADMGAVLAYVDQIRAVAAGIPDIDATPELTLTNVMRADTGTLSEGVYTDAVVANAPDHDGNFFFLKKIL
mgnify:FL=1